MATHEKIEVKDLRPRFVLVSQDAIRNYMAKVGRPAWATYLALCLFADNRTGECWPALDTIAEIVGCDRKTVRLDIDALEEGGLVTRLSRTGTSNVYLLNEVAKTGRPNFAPPPQGENGTGGGGENGPRTIPSRTITSDADASEAAIAYQPDEPEPEPEVDPVTERKLLKRSIAALKKLYAYHNGGKPLPMTGALHKNLSDAIFRCKGWSFDEFTRALENYYASDVPKSTSPVKWLPSLETYAAGPVDRYGKPKEEHSAKARTKADDRDAIRRARFKGSVDDGDGLSDDVEF
jgi:hypothetical protein